MEYAIEECLFDFLERYYQVGRHLLLGFSGGHDSRALLYSLLKWKSRFSLEIALAHVDHGWRSESQLEAEELRKLAQELSLPFHLRRITPGELKGNLESAAREVRLAFFSALCQQYQYQAVLLGHQRDDQVETVLKRVLEGATLPRLSGLSEVTTIEGITIWRPLLRVDKETILN